nr:ribosomal protein S15 [Abelia chinensis var. chinensis]
MLKNAFVSIILEEENKENRGSAEFQVVNFTNKIRKLTSHFELHKKDYLSQRGLRKILGKRQRLLAYLSKKNRIRYKELIDQLNNRIRYKELIDQLNIRETKVD